MPGPPQSEDLLSQLLDVDFALRAAGLGVWELDPVTQLIKWDDRCCQLFGLTKTGSMAYEEAIRYIHPEDIDRIDQAVQWAMNPQSGGVYDQIYRTIGADDGQLRWVRFMGKSYFYPDGRIYRFAGVALEVSQQVLDQQVLQEARARQTYLLALSDRLRWLTDPIQIQYQAACLLGELLGANRVGYAQTQNDQKFVAVTRNYTQGVPSIEGVYRYNDYGPDLLASMQAGKTVVRPDIAGDPTLTEAEKTAHAVLQLGATLNVPLVKEGQLVAILFVHYQERHVFPEYEVGLVQETAERIWAAVEQARAEEALRQSEAKFRRLSESGLIAVAFFEIGGAIVEANDAFLAMLGVTRDELNSQKIRWDVYTAPAWMPRTQQAIEEFRQSGSIGPYEKQFYHTSGEVRWGIFAGATLGDGKTGVSLVVDITDRKMAEEELREADRRKDEFLALLAHELRNPITTLSNALMLLEATGGNDEQLPLDSIQPMMSREVTHLVRLIDDLLDISRINQGKIELRRQRLDLTVLVNEVTTTMRPLIKQANLQLITQLPTQSVSIEGDADRLRQVLRNLLGNAVKFTPAEGRITVSLETVGEEVCLRVKDTGIGLQESDLTRIFDMFAQVDASRTRSQGGLGLGLTLVQELIQLHNGRVEARSEGLGQGSEFILYLPLSISPAD